MAERSDLTEPAWELTRDAFPEYNNHGDVLNLYWGRLLEEPARAQSAAPAFTNSAPHPQISQPQPIASHRQHRGLPQPDSRDEDAS